MTAKSLKETEKIAKEFIKNLIPNKDTALVITLYGELGSGKTTFVKYIAKTFGLEKTITRPTFVIEKIYKIEDKNFDYLIHIDAYRLKEGEELKQLGWKEILENPKNLIFIEWPENVKDILPENKQEIHFKFIDENTREIKVK